MNTYKFLKKKRLKCLETHENIINEMKSKTLFATQIVNERLQEYKEHKKTFINCTTRIMNIVEKLNFSLDVEKILQEKLCDFTQEYWSFTSALPIYGKKQEILRKIAKKQ